MSFKLQKVELGLLISDQRLKLCSMLQLIVVVVFSNDDAGFFNDADRFGDAREKGRKLVLQIGLRSFIGGDENLEKLGSFKKV